VDDTEKPATYGSDGTCQNDGCTRKTVKKGPYGPPRLYCSNACRVAAYRQRQADNPPARPAPATNQNVTDENDSDLASATLDDIARYVKDPAVVRTTMLAGGVQSEAALKILTDVAEMVDRSQRR